MTTAFVLSGSGSLGAVQVGMLQALADRGFHPDLLVGASAGALNAALVSGTEVLLSNGDPVPALLASAAIPAVLPAVEIDGRFLFDGGVADNTPISQAVALGADRVVVLEAEHLCMTLRGVQAGGAHTVTSALHGLLRDDPATRAEFLALTGVGP